MFEDFFIKRSDLILGNSIKASYRSISETQHIVFSLNYLNNASVGRSRFECAFEIAIHMNEIRAHEF